MEKTLKATQLALEKSHACVIRQKQKTSKQKVKRKQIKLKCKELEAQLASLLDTHSAEIGEGKENNIPRAAKQKEHQLTSSMKKLRLQSLPPKKKKRTESENNPISI